MRLKPESVISSHTNKIPDIKYKENSNKKKSPKKTSIVDPSWEYVDPTPDIHALFTQFDNRFFWGKLRTVEVRWSPRMTSCAGLCHYEGRGGLCSVRLSIPLLKLRPRKDLVQTLLHEMIHAYLFVTHNNRDREGHGPEFSKHMHRINKEAGTNITIFHSFHDEVKLYQQHWWRCDGPCQRRPPYFGMVKRAMNRAPGPNDFWWEEHQATCGGRYVKVHEPPGFSEKKAKQISKKSVSASSGGKSDIRNFFPFHGKGNMLGNSSTDGVGGTEKTFSKLSDKSQASVCRSITDNVTGFRNLFNKNVNAAGSHDRQKMNDSSNGGVSSGSIHKKSGIGDKARTLSHENKDIARPGRFVGTLANRGGGTLIVTAKGRNKGASNVKTVNGNLYDGNKLISNFVPFSGKGHTLGAGSEIRRVSHSREFETIASNSMKNHVISEDSVQSSSNRASPNEVTSSKRYGSAIQYDVKKRMKNQSVSDFSVDPGKHSASNDSNVKCPVCNSDIRELDINTHLDSCLGTCCDDDEPMVIDNCSVKLETDSEMIKCPACNSEMLKCDLNIHLDMCLGSVFGSASVDDDDDDDYWGHKRSVSVKPGCNAYPCPCCAMLVKDTEMNMHLEHCLTET
ncbi:sprT-like domain-containing protein Spartan isoform X2 [Cryptotermes secundus]|uniref:sprT-like domain-containing protein Spartan isoform X2 n=1 Tax=Cryptotermes secundus TaxID=105785 RepID=UPI001454CC03|nr:sprT-like domain-containing protein Spartan isoform X2 [Cryptotermes secundus]